ncbi:ATP-binding SpoIIE family protein phosphatase [Chromatium okenii]|jgi:DNA-binding response OmpR family regulator|uniref:Serine/threonine protein phosphatase n=1 Tax=Chromatium okenii TaxID=61644 RepID=A0A2S7XRE1_9GAMM|nr:SpoIIE family protein phosphatase [Chromatium okenii]PQJ96290.1 serine/threonine protein phosphatase [Chromatium okenii]
MVKNASVEKPMGWRGCALVVDDDPISRHLLARMLQHEGFRTESARDGKEAVVQFAALHPQIDLVFMDALMPCMDGFEATRQIKALTKLNFVPVIFQSALQDEDSLLRGIEAGGDDFLTKPYNHGLLRARIFAMERMRDLQRHVAAEHLPLLELLEREDEEQALAERIFSRAIKNRNVATDQLGLLLRPAAMFSGDLVLTQHLPDGGLRVLLGDFTGHGLAAAVAALPVADAFHAMTRKGVEDAEILAELNRKLYQLLPIERFMAACLVSIPGDGQILHWWNGGLPSAWLRTQDGLHELTSHALPLGILPELPDSAGLRQHALQAGDSLLMFSDGLLEAQNRDGIPFENAGFRPTINAWQHADTVFSKMIEALDTHCLNTEQADDIAVVEIPLNCSLFTAPQATVQRAVNGGWNWAIELRDEHLGNLRSVDAMLRPLGLLDGLDAHLVALETIVAELYSNALEHGILKLPSSLKSAPDGFEVYYERRADSLSAGCLGCIRLEINYKPNAVGGHIHIRFRDSGTGFDVTDWQLSDPNIALAAARPWGRGIALVRQLCESLTYHDQGRVVEAVYRW